MKLKMKGTAALLVMVLLGCGVAACGGAGKEEGSASHASTAAAGSGAQTAATSRPAPPGSYVKNDGDTDADDIYHGARTAADDDPTFLAAYGNEADRADRRAVTVVVKSYYTAAAAGDGAKACSLLYASLAAGLTQGQSRSVHSGGRACVAAMSLLLEQQHEQLAADEVPTMVVTGVRVEGNVGLAVLGFRTKPEAEILLQREGGAWRINALFDSEMP